MPSILRCCLLLASHWPERLLPPSPFAKTQDSSTVKVGLDPIRRTRASLPANDADGKARRQTLGREAFGCSVATRGCSLTTVIYLSAGLPPTRSRSAGVTVPLA